MPTSNFLHCINSILILGRCKKEEVDCFNKLGLCSHPNTLHDMQKKATASFHKALMEWKSDTENCHNQIKFLEEVRLCACCWWAIIKYRFQLHFMRRLFHPMWKNFDQSNKIPGSFALNKKSTLYGGSLRYLAKWKVKIKYFWHVTCNTQSKCHKMNCIFSILTYTHGLKNVKL